LASSLRRAFRTLQFEYRTASARILVNIDRDAAAARILQALY